MYCHRSAVLVRQSAHRKYFLSSTIGAATGSQRRVHSSCMLARLHYNIRNIDRLENHEWEELMHAPPDAIPAVMVMLLSLFKQRPPMMLEN